MTGWRPVLKEYYKPVWINLPGNLFSQLHSKGFKSNLVLHSGGEHAMNHDFVNGFALNIEVVFYR